MTKVIRSKKCSNVQKNVDKVLIFPYCFYIFCQMVGGVICLPGRGVDLPVNISIFFLPFHLFISLFTSTSTAGRSVYMGRI